jgi:hypothetical protein
MGGNTDKQVHIQTDKYTRNGPIRAEYQPRKKPGRDLCLGIPGLFGCQFWERSLEKSFEIFSFLSLFSNTLDPRCRSMPRKLVGLSPEGLKMGAT